MGRKEWITVTAAQVLTVGSERLSDTLTVRATMPGLCLSPGADRRVGVGGEGVSDQVVPRPQYTHIYTDTWQNRIPASRDAFFKVSFFYF